MLYQIIYWLNICKSISETSNDKIIKNQEEEVHFPHVYANCIQTYPGKDLEFSSESEGSVFEAQPLENLNLKDCYKPNNSKIIYVDYPDVNAIYEKQEDHNEDDPYYYALRETEQQNKKSKAFYIKIYQNPCYFLFFLVVFGALLILGAYAFIFRRYWILIVVFFVCITSIGACAIKKSFKTISEIDNSGP